MPLQDIKYVMSVDDGQARQAIARTVKDLRGLDGKSFGGKEAEQFGRALSSIGDGAGDVLRGLGDEVGQIFGGSFLGNVLGDGLGNAITAGVGASGGAITGAFGLAGTQAGMAMGANYLKEATKYFLEAAKALDRITTVSKFDVSKLLPKMDFAPMSDMMGKAMEASMAKLKVSTAPLRRFLANQLAGFAVGLPEIIGSELAQRLPKLGAVTNAFKELGSQVATPIKLGMEKAFQGMGAMAASAMTVVAGAVAIGAVVVGAAFGAISMYANKVWSEVEDGVMRAQSALVSMGASVEEAFSDDVAERILNVADTMAYGMGAMNKDVAATTAHLMKNGMDMEQALSRVGLAQNIAIVNGISMQEASEKIIAAWNGEVRSLKDIGVRMKSTGDISKDAAMAMDKLIERYGNPALAKPFIDDDPMKRASAAVNELWAKLGQVLDGSITSAWGEIADVILGIADSLKNMGNGDFIPTVDGVLAAIGATVTTVINAGVVVGNVFQMVVTGVKMVGLTIWYGIQYGWNWLSEKLGSVIQTLGKAVSLIPGTGDQGEKLQKAGEEMAKSSKAAMEKAGEGFGKAATDNFEALKRDAKDIGRALSPDGGAVGEMARRGKAAREKAEQEAQAAKPKELGESEKVKEERERKAQEEAEKRAKKRQETFEQNRRVQEERNRYGRQQRQTIVLQTPMRMNAALRYGR